ncbi:MAG: hypothetical protein HKL84_06330, partial [Acidimicrobiaceae bacterium]|nr:hypothetical protein [Acidimicrobiaceae bacterium]
MLKKLDLRAGSDDYLSWLPRPKITNELPVDAVRGIIARVRHGGDKALLELTAEFDKVRIDSVVVGHADLEDAYKRISSDLRNALEVAA